MNKTAVAKELVSIAKSIVADGMVMTNLAELPRMTLSEIASLVRIDWKAVNYAAKPYLDAMQTLQHIDDNYGLDRGSSIVAYFLSNSSSYRGPVAVAIKKELNRRLR